MTTTRLRPQGGGTPAISLERLQYLEQVEVQFRDLEVGYNNLERKFQELEERFREEREEVRRLQAVDFSRGKKDDSRPHDSISQSLDEVFRKSVHWAREYFRIDLKDFQIERFPAFERELRRVSWNNSGWRKKKHLNVSHLVQAAVAERLATRFFTDPFAGCEKSLRKNCNDIYKAMLEENRGEANQWRATTLSAYEKFKKWPPPSSSAPSPSPPTSPSSLFSLSGSHKATPRSIAWYHAQYHETVFNEIESIVGPIANKYFPKRKDEERHRKCREFIKAAGELAVELGSHAAELKVFGKLWFEGPEQKRLFYCEDERMKDRFDEEDINPDEKPTIDIILRPCLMKYGNDKGEDYEKSCVWVPALVDLKRPPPKP